MGTSVQYQPQPSYSTQMSDTLLAQAQMESGTGKFAKVGPRIDLERKYAPQYQQLQMDMLKQSLPDILKMYNDQISPAMANAENASRMISRTGDIQSIEQLGGRARAALAGANPDQAKLVDTMTKQANAGMAAGSMLTPEQRRAIEQDVRASFSSRGLAMSPGAGVQEVVRSQLAGMGMQQQRQQMGGQALAASQAFYGDPFQQILGRPSQAFGAGGSVLGQAGGMNPGAIFNPESNLASNIYNSNSQGQNAANIANASNSSGLFGSFLGLGGKMLGASTGGGGSIFSKILGL